MNALLATLRSLGPARLAAIAGVGAATIGFFIFITARISAPTYSLLYSDLDLRDSSQIVQKLDALNVPYQLRGDGAQILVPADQVARLRMTMAESGLPRGGSIGYELFDKSDMLGTSSFVQNVNHVRALEGELARTISAIGGVQTARVHLVLPRREMFSRERQEPSASIVLKLRGAERLGKGQVAAVQHLVAAAVPGLRPNRISIVDGAGNLLARGTDGGDAQTAGIDGEERRIGYETRMARAVEEMLERSVGFGKVRAEVHAEMDFDRITTSSESYDPDGQVVRSTQTVSESNDSTDAADQSVTVANNLPDAQNAKGSGGARSRNARNEETTNYEITKTVRNQIREGGVVRRLSVAVLVDGTYAPGPDGGARVYQPRSPEEIQLLTTLVRSAIGFDAQRGDTVEVVNMRFIAPDDGIADSGGSLLGLSKADLFRIGETVMLLLVALLVVLLVVRPMMRRMVPAVAGPAGALAGVPGGDVRLIADRSGSGGAQAALPPPGGGAAGDEGGGEGATALVPGSQASASLEAIEQMIDINQVEGRVRASSIKKIGEIVDKHPEEAVAIIRSWMYQGA